MGFLLGLYLWGRFLILFMLYLSIINTYLVFNNIYIYVCMYLLVLEKVLNGTISIYSIYLIYVS